MKKMPATAAVLSLTIAGVIFVAGVALAQTATKAPPAAEAANPADRTKAWEARKAEHEARIKAMIGKRFDALDSNHDGVLSKDEFTAGAQKMMHRMRHHDGWRGHGRRDWGHRDHGGPGPHGPKPHGSWQDQPPAPQPDTGAASSSK